MEDGQASGRSAPHDKQTTQTVMILGEYGPVPTAMFPILTAGPCARMARTKGVMMANKMTREDWCMLYYALYDRMHASRTDYVQDRYGSTHRVEVRTYTGAQNRRWFLNQLKQRGLLDNE